MRLHDVPDRHDVVVEESVERFELPLRAHHFRETAAKITRQGYADAFKPRATTSIPSAAP